MPGLASAGFPVLEGDYSDWTIYDSFVDTDAYMGLWPQLAITNKDETEVLIMDIWNDIVKRYTIATKTLSGRIIEGAVFGDAPWAAGMLMRSILCTYVAVIDGYTELKIFKNGALIKTFTDAQLGFTSAEILTASFSPSGKYLIVSGYRTDAQMGWVVLVGS